MSNKSYKEMTLGELKMSIVNHGQYSLPKGFQYEDLDTKLHKAVRSLIAEDRIEIVGGDKSHNVWGPK